MKRHRISKIATFLSILGTVAALNSNVYGTIWNVDYAYSGAEPPDPKPWLQISTQQYGVDQVQVVISSLLQPSTPLTGTFIGSVGMNYGGTAALTFSGPTINGTFDTPTAAYSPDGFSFDGGGYYDIKFDFSTANGGNTDASGNNSLRFDAFDQVSYIITGAGLTVGMFDEKSTPHGGNGTWEVSAFLQGYGDSSWNSVLTNPIPEPTTVIAGALLLLPFGFSTLRMLRKNR